MRSPWPNFSVEELACGRGECPHCGGLMDMSPVFMRHLGTLRKHFDAPMVVTSGYRCAKHNEEVGGAERSAHLIGLAVDIAIEGREARRLIQLALNHDFAGIWTRQHGARRLVHIDDAPDIPDVRPRPWFGTYA